MDEYKKLKVLVDEKDKELSDTREVASREIEELRVRLSYANKWVKPMFWRRFHQSQIRFYFSDNVKH